jgi:hypothetical protein
MSAKKRGRKIRMKNKKDKRFIKAVVNNMTGWLNYKITSDGWMRKLFHMKKL